jgi:hypothetical protein
LNAALRREALGVVPQVHESRVISWRTYLKPAMGIAASLAVGVLAGALLFPRTVEVKVAQGGGPKPAASTPSTIDLTNTDVNANANTPLTTAVETAAPASLSGETEIANVRFIDQNSAGDGTVEFAFDAIRPVRIKGNVNDPKIQEMLTYALVKEHNAGVRLRAVSTISANHSKPDSKVKEALLTALRSDSNDGVRKEALAVLQKYPFDEEIQVAFLYVLQNDPNPAMRIEAIKSLEAKNIEGKQLIQVLRDRMESDNNSFIRQKAKAVLEEVEVQ